MSADLRPREGARAGLLAPPPAGGRGEPVKLMVLAHHGLGDVITGLPLLRLALERFGPANVAVLCRVATMALVKSQGVERVHAVGSAAATFATAVALRRRGFRLLVALPTISRLKLDLLCAATLTRRVRAGEPVPLNREVPIARAFQQLADALGLGPLPPPSFPPGWPRSPLAEGLAAEWRDWRGFGVRLAVHLGSDPHCPHKRWALDRFIDCVRAVDRAVPGLGVALVGTEVALAGRFRAAAGSSLRPIDLTGLTGVEDAARFVREADALLSGDTALMHLAGALGVPAFSVFGPTSPACWFPPGNAGRWFQDLNCGGPCYPRLTRGCVRARCVDRVSPEQVAAALISALAARRAPAGRLAGV